MTDSEHMASSSENRVHIQVAVLGHSLSPSATSLLYEDSGESLRWL